jgi:UV DNA damage repair endonuclease
MHPGQFCCLASDNDDVIKRSIEEFEYHVDMIRWMGFGQEFQDFKCNVHLSGRGGTDTFRKSYAQLSPEARNVITIENDEYSSGLDKILEISDIVALVFDNHHHFIHSHGEHLLPSDEKIQKVIDSWRGVRPAMHYSVSKEEYLDLQDSNSLPNFDHFIDKGIKKGKLRAHSDYYPNRALNKLIYQFWDHFDIMCESKNKNLASMRLYEDFLSKPI